MSPGRRYLFWNVGIWLVVAAVLVYFYSSPTQGVGLAQSLLAAAWLAVVWGIVSYAVWRLLRAGQAGARTDSEWLWFAAWVVLGLAAAAAAVRLSPLSLLPAAAVAGLLVYRRGISRSAYGLVGGLGSLLILSMVWENARTPHECRWVPHEDAFSCPNHAGFAAPFALGVLLLILGVVAQVRRRRAY